MRRFTHHAWHASAERSRSRRLEMTRATLLLPMRAGGRLFGAGTPNGGRLATSMSTKLNIGAPKIPSAAACAAALAATCRREALPPPQAVFLLRAQNQPSRGEAHPNKGLRIADARRQHVRMTCHGWHVGRCAMDAPPATAHCRLNR